MNPNEAPSDPLQQIVDFLARVGIPPIEATLPAKTFLPGLAISGGRLLYDRNRLLWPGDLLHEAGHIAVMPAEKRSALDAALPNLGGISYAGEPEATAWAFAAVVAIGLDPAILFHAGGYGGHSAHLVFSYANGCCPGAGGLHATGMTLSIPDSQKFGIPPYPHMIRWLRA